MSSRPCGCWAWARAEALQSIVRPESVPRKDPDRRGGRGMCARRALAPSGPWLRRRARSTRARVCAPRSSSRALGPWLRGRARSTRFRSRSRPSLGGAGTRLRLRRSCRLRDSQSRAAQGRSVAADGARHAATKGSDGRHGASRDQPAARRPAPAQSSAAEPGLACDGGAAFDDDDALVARLPPLASSVSSGVKSIAIG